MFAGISLGQATDTTGQVEAAVTYDSIAVVLLIGLGVFAVVRRGLRPVEAMARQADRITGGDLTGRVAAHNPQTEVGRLGAALNGMLARIEASQQQMRRFFADASHELRTPLASLRANAQLCQQGARQDPGEVDEVMDRIVAETRRMGRLVDDMLGLARLGQHPCQPREPVDLTAVVTGCAQRAQVADPALAWQVRVAEGLTVTGDQELLRRAIDNLLTNVLVHTPPGTAGAISASAAGDWVTIEVSDDGPGVPPDHLPHIFERFYRAATRPGRSGSGLGLAIAAETASAHGGTTQATPVSPHGLRVTLTLPARPDPRPHPSWQPPSAELPNSTPNGPRASTAGQVPDRPLNLAGWSAAHERDRQLSPVPDGPYGIDARAHEVGLPVNAARRSSTRARPFGMRPTTACCADRRIGCRPRTPALGCSWCYLPTGETSASLADRERVSFRCDHGTGYRGVGLLTDSILRACGPGRSRAGDLTMVA